MVCDIWAEVEGYVEDLSWRMQDLAYRLQLVLEWCEGVAHSLSIPLPLMLEGI